MTDGDTEPCWTQGSPLDTSSPCNLKHDSEQAGPSCASTQQPFCQGSTLGDSFTSLPRAEAHHSTVSPLAGPSTDGCQSSPVKCLEKYLITRLFLSSWVLLGWDHRSCLLSEYTWFSFSSKQNGFSFTQDTAALLLTHSCSTSISTDPQQKAKTTSLWHLSSEKSPEDFAHKSSKSPC